MNYRKSFDDGFKEGLQVGYEKAKAELEVQLVTHLKKDWIKVMAEKHIEKAELVCEKYLFGIGGETIGKIKRTIYEPIGLLIEIRPTEKFIEEIEYIKRVPNRV